jgi:hypothetical protein
MGLPGTAQGGQSLGSSWQLVLPLSTRLMALCVPICVESNPLPSRTPSLKSSLPLLALFPVPNIVWELMSAKVPNGVWELVSAKSRCLGADECESPKQCWGTDECEDNELPQLSID